MEPTEEQKKMAEEQKKMMEAQKRMMEEQMAMRRKQGELTLKQLKLNQRLVLKTIDRMKADKEVIEQVELAEEKNEVRKKAIRAKLAELDIIIEGENLKLEMIDFNIKGVEAQLAAPSPGR